MEWEFYYTCGQEQSNYDIHYKFINGWFWFCYDDIAEIKI